MSVNQANYEPMDATDGGTPDAVISAKFKAAITPPLNLKGKLLAQKHRVRPMNWLGSPRDQQVENETISLTA